MAHTVQAQLRLWTIEGSVRLPNLLWFSRERNHKLRVFNLDLHVGVIGDLEPSLLQNSIEVVRFSISNHNGLTPGRPPVSDPVRFISNRNWERLDQKKIWSFQSRYGNFLKRFDGFVVTHTPSFTELYAKFDKPILCVVSTRYEAPYTNRPRDWERLNQLLIEGHASQQIQLVANNKGDKDYLKSFTGIEVPVIASLGDSQHRWRGKKEAKVFICKNQQLSLAIEEATGFKPLRSLGSPYTWQDLLDCREILVIPQNISTMTLFELATAGAPVWVPSKEFLKKLHRDYGVLKELTYANLKGISVSLDKSSPINWSSDLYLDWWLERADFYDEGIMPNVRTFDSFKELRMGNDSSNDFPLMSAHELELRNRSIQDAWNSVIAGFASRAS